MWSYVAPPWIYYWLCQSKPNHYDTEKWGLRTLYYDVYWTTFFRKPGSSHALLRGLLDDVVLGNLGLRTIYCERAISSKWSFTCLFTWRAICFLLITGALCRGSELHISISVASGMQPRRSLLALSTMRPSLVAHRLVNLCNLDKKFTWRTRRTSAWIMFHAWLSMGG